MAKILFYCVALLLAAACGSDNPGDRSDGFSDVSKSPEDSLFQEVMDGHDEAMAKMGKLAGYRKKAGAKLDSLKSIKSAAKASLGKTYEQLSEELKSAEDHMNTWMHDFSIDSAQDNLERRLKYLGAEKEKVNRVKEEILQVISKADSLLGGDKK